MTRHLLVICGIVLVTAALPVRSVATSVVRFPFDALCAEADRVLHVECLSTESELDSEAQRVFTRVRFRVIDAIKVATGSDAMPKEVQIRLPGGRAGGRTQFVPGMPAFQPGLETVLFLTPPVDGGSAWPIGLYQGCYPVVPDESGQRHVQLQSGVTPLPEGAVFKPTSHRPYTVELDVFRNAILDAIRRTTPSEPSP